jgi:hypothetical protein
MPEAPSTDSPTSQRQPPQWWILVAFLAACAIVLVGCYFLFKLAMSEGG